MNGIRRALVLSTSERYFTLAANFLTLAIVSRLLTPAEIGVSVLGMAIVMMAFSVREFTTTNVIIQRPQLKLEDVRATFTLLVLVTGTMSFLIMAGAGGLAALYNEPRLVPFLRLVSLCVLMEVIGLTVGALLRREMAFGKLAVINITTAGLTSGLTITLAALGFSYMSFAWAILVGRFVEASLFLLVWQDKSIFKPCLKEWRNIMTFGGYNGANAVLATIYESLPYIVFGRILSVDAVAVYNRGHAICQLPGKVILGGVGSVLLSAFSAEVRNGRKLRDHYLHSIELISGLWWPALILLAILADPVVRVLLGEQWLGAVPLVRIMAIANLFLFSVLLNYPVLVSVGAMRDLFIRSVITWPVSAVVITCAAFFGLKAAAFSLLFTLPFQAVVSVYFVQRHLDVTWRDIIFSLRKAAVLVLFSAIGPLSIVLLMGGQFDLSILSSIGVIVLGSIGWGLGLRLTDHPLLREIEHAVRTLVGSPLTARIRSHALWWEKADH
jgi:O-antigen/teichoic acid export membrane protein